MKSLDVKNLTRKTIEKVCQDSFSNRLSRKYYRFRYSSQFYGGIVTGDVIGCNLRCAYCWSQKTAWNTRKGSWYDPNQVVNALLNLSKKNNCHKIRLSGGEPTLCKNHLLTVLRQMPDEIFFILETNGILLSQDSYIQDLEELHNPPHIRISLKAGETFFSVITYASLNTYEKQIHAIRLLKQSSLQFNVAIMAEFFTAKEISKLQIEIFPKQLEIESLIMYPFVKEELQKRGFSMK
ncbi:MAG: radical SAM protein [Candidatus Hodarchaeota archaeon]